MATIKRGKIVAWTQSRQGNSREFKGNFVWDLPFDIRPSVKGAEALLKRAAACVGSVSLAYCVEGVRTRNRIGWPITVTRAAFRTEMNTSIGAGHRKEPPTTEEHAVRRESLRAAVDAAEMLLTGQPDEAFAATLPYNSELLPVPQKLV